MFVVIVLLIIYVIGFFLVIQERQIDNKKLIFYDVKCGILWPMWVLIGIFAFVMLFIGPLLWLNKKEDYRDSQFKNKLDKYLGVIVQC